jgi:hypothetical protein
MTSQPNQRNKCDKELMRIINIAAKNSGGDIEHDQERDEIIFQKKGGKKKFRLKMEIFRKL